MKKDWKIRPVQKKDAAQLAQIYAPYVRETVITLEGKAPSAAEMAARAEAAQREYPWLVCEEDGRVLACAYAQRLQQSAAFRWSAQISIYVSWPHRGQGMGSALYRELERLLKKAGCMQLYAKVVVPNPESVGFCHARGFEELCLYPHVGYKLGKWCDVSVLAKQLQPLPKRPRPLQNWRETAKKREKTD
ncbi:MAG: GNAT family N-acetyltransferase [Oscillospiraceae bacterium]|jgi:L-amino acid N-acyltransferase YncA|nr:GNAT family N-acetyltransferase [Oscillospiraceae bacterium]MDD3260574.1 GNAT family N-acetyltransferase [Oscillospiraceae bacterium]